MRILFATYSLAFQNPGGGEQVLLALEQALQERGHEVVFYDPWKVEPVGFDLIHFFSCLENRFWTYAKTRSPKTPLVVTPVLYAAPGARSRFSVIRQKLLEEPGARPDLWLAASAAEEKTIRQRYGEDERIRILPNGVDAAFASADPSLFRLWLRESTMIEGPFVLHVGRFHPVKNQLALIHACKQAKVPCVFIGGADIGQETYHLRCVEEGKGAAAFVGALKHEDPLLASAYAAAAVFALPSRFETFGISALEAGCAGTPLVLSSEMQEKALFKRFGPEWVAPDDVFGLSQAIQRAMKTGRGAPSTSKELLWPSIAETLERFYDELISARLGNA